MMRIRQAHGTSWRDPRQPGTRHWQSTSVSYGFPGWALLIWWPLVPFALMFWAACWLLLAELWLCAEFYVLAVSGVYVLVRIASHHGRAADITLTRLAFGLRAVALR